MFWSFVRDNTLTKLQNFFKTIRGSPDAYYILKSTPSKAILFSNDKMALLGVDFKYPTSKHLPYRIPNAL